MPGPAPITHLYLSATSTVGTGSQVGYTVINNSDAVAKPTLVHLL